METKEYFEKVMQDYNQNRKGRNLHKYCLNEGIDYKNSRAGHSPRFQFRPIENVHI